MILKKQLMREYGLSKWRKRMNLDDVIRDYGQYAIECRMLVSAEKGDCVALKDEATEYEQLVDWLIELRMLREKVQLLLEKQKAKKPEMIWDTTFGKVRPHCPVCRASNSIGSNYCWNCGQRFKAEVDNEQ